MDIEVGSSTNVDIFYLFLTMSFSICSFTSIPCMELEDTGMDKLYRGIYRCSTGASNPSRKACMVIYASILIHKQRMVIDIHTMDKPTTICESLDRILCPSLGLYPTTICQIQIPNQIRELGSCILERGSLHSIQLLFQSLALSPKVLFHLPTAFYASPLFVLMHTFPIMGICTEIYKCSA